MRILLALALLSSSLRADTSLDDALRIFDVDDSSPDAAPPKPAPKPLPKSALDLLDELQSREQSLHDEVFKTIQPQRDSLAASWRKLAAASPGSILDSMADDVVAGILPRGDTRYDTTRISGRLDWEYNRFMVFLPNGRFRYHAKTNPDWRWEWLDFSRGIIAINWANGGQLLNVGESSASTFMSTTHWWGHNKMKRFTDNSDPSLPDGQPPALPPDVLRQIDAHRAIESEARNRLATAIRIRRAATVANLRKVAPSLDPKAAKALNAEIQRLSLPAGHLPGSDRLSGSWSWPSSKTASFQPDGTFSLDNQPSGSWQWAGSAGGHFYVIQPNIACTLCRLSKSSANTLRAIDDTGRKFDLKKAPETIPQPQPGLRP